jgi:spoIIIJ-associated protein
MEWVETTGRTLEEAKEAALDQLGVDEQDAEFEVIEEPRSGLFGRLRTEARVRARVRPTTPRPKAERRDRKRRTERTGSGRREARPAEKAIDQEVSVPTPSGEVGAQPADGGRGRGRGRRGGGTTTTHEPATTSVGRDAKGAAAVEDSPDFETVAADLKEFLEGLVDAFEVEGDVSVTQGEDEAVEGRIDGGDLGLLIGPKGATLTAIQELARSAVAHGPTTRLRLDVGGYRERRREALERFTQTVAQQVLSSGQAVSLEPMGAADRKVVHDTANPIDGVNTTSEGEEPRRRVVILPD